MAYCTAGYGGMMKKIGMAFFLAVFLLGCSQRGPDAAAVQSEIRTVLQRQQAAWNAHDIEGFMADYWKSEKLTFQSGGKRYLGWDTLLQRYKTNYAGTQMGKLSFSGIEVQILSKEYAYVLGRWKVEQKESASEGVFTIILKRFASGWKIIHDHSSS